MAVGGSGAGSISPSLVQELLRGMAELQKQVHTQQQQMNAIAAEVRAGVQEELGSLWKALRDARSEAGGGSGGSGGSGGGDGRGPVVNLEAARRAERAEAALDDATMLLERKEAECDALRRRLRALEGVGAGAGGPTHAPFDRPLLPPDPRDSGIGRNDDELNDVRAATRVQAVQRGRNARQQVRNSRGMPFAEQVPGGGFLFNEDEASTRVQAAVRGRQARQTTAQMAAERSSSMHHLPSRGGSLQYSEDDAATRLQAMQRGRQQRRGVRGGGGGDGGVAGEDGPGEMSLVEDMREENDFDRMMKEDSSSAAAGTVGEQQGLDRNQAAARVQAHQRGRLARRGRGPTVPLPPDPSDEFAYLDDADGAGAAATRVQARIRGRQVRRGEDRRFAANSPPAAEEMNAGHHLERTDPVAHDGAAEATDYRYSEDEAATRLQARQRGRQQRRGVRGGYVNAEAEAAAEGETAEALASYGETEAEAATRLQAVQRGRVQRRRLIGGSQPAAYPDAVTSGEVAAGGYSEEQAATRLQARQRGNMQRRAGRQPVTTELTGAAAVRDYRYSEDEAATRLQAMQRGRQQRRRLNGGVEDGVYEMDDVEETDDLALPDELPPSSPDGAAPGVGGDDPGAFGSTGAFD